MTTAGAPAVLRPGLLYSQCWEDVDVARAALRIQPGATVLAIAAAGDNVLALLQDDPGRLLAVDINPSQTALVALKIAAIRGLDDADRACRFLGGAECPDRLDLYGRIRPAMGPDARAYWDANPAMIERGVIHAGRFERYLAVFRRVILPIVPGRQSVRGMLGAASLAEQRRIYAGSWDSRRWRLLFRVFFSRRLLERFGRDRAFFDQCGMEDIGDHYLSRARHALTNVPISDNPYLAYMLSGRVETGRRAPDYLKPSVQSIVRERADRVVLRTASLDAVLRTLPSGSVDAFYLSDVFELSAPAEYAATLSEVARVGRPGARICYWSNLVPRHRPDALAGRIRSHPGEAALLYARDRAFLYSALAVESVGSGAT
jgi:S-adenosylmethionine-diacylglycerol 3-amino-3-carboxypropyl transferase